MNFRVGKTYRWMLLATLVLSGALAVIHFTSLFCLRRVRLVPAEARAESALLNRVVGKNIFELPVPGIMKELMRENKILRVEVKYSLPDELEIVLNNLEPLAVILTPQGKMAAVNREGYMTPFQKGLLGQNGFVFPIITGVDEHRPYERVANHAVALVVEQLDRLAIGDREIYLMLSDIDLSKPEEAVIHLDGVPSDVVMYPGDLAKNLQKLKCFLLDYQPDLEHVYKLDMRADGLIVAAGAENEARDTTHNGN